MQLHLGKAERALKLFPQKGRGLGHVTLNFLAYNRTYLQNYFSYRVFKFGTQLPLGKAERARQ